MMRRNVLVCGFLLFACALPAIAGGYTAEFPTLDGATYVGSETCLDCHDDVADFFQHTAHSVERAFMVPGSEAASCEACHGPGSLHVDNDGDGYIAGPTLLADVDADARRMMCTQCHEPQGDVWHAGPHADADLDCFTCHADMVHVDTDVRPAADFRVEGEFCLQCHQEQVADFRMPYRHRVIEGEIGCTDCHSPHGEMEASFGIDGANTACFGCHTEMAGPFVFEHDGVQGEDCTACHTPHGSINDKLLVQDANGLCLQCHYEPEFPTIGAVPHAGFLTQEGRCYDCHREIHGSNLDPNFQDR
jgi:DmsE family decaheme c-type cytochrome